MPTTATQNRIAKLQRELRDLKAGTPSVRTKESTRYNNCLGHTLARGVKVNTRTGSLYATLLRVNAALGHLADQDQLFGVFKRADTVEAARELLRQIGVARTELDGYLRLDEDFEEHCQKRTKNYKKRAAAGDQKAAGILNNPKICDANKKWVGDVEEALHILCGGRHLSQLRRGKNVGILRRAGLMFDMAEIDGVVNCFLYKRKYHGVFKRALTRATM